MFWSRPYSRWRTQVSSTADSSTSSEYMFKPERSSNFRARTRCLESLARLTDFSMMDTVYWSTCTPLRSIMSRVSQASCHMPLDTTALIKQLNDTLLGGMPMLFISASNSLAPRKSPSEQKPFKNVLYAMVSSLPMVRISAMISRARSTSPVLAHTSRTQLYTAMSGLMPDSFNFRSTSKARSTSLSRPAALMSDMKFCVSTLGALLNSSRDRSVRPHCTANFMRQPYIIASGCIPCAVISLYKSQALSYRPAHAYTFIRALYPAMVMIFLLRRNFAISSAKRRNLLSAQDSSKFMHKLSLMRTNDFCMSSNSTNASKSL
mmetsp:Transcript_110685/g.195599  ORF Transcript_110685/g.195599 Transcript_110685/m.195599 type:complete len:320 (+) Transcript_110685:64-1023(+)